VKLRVLDLGALECREQVLLRVSETLSASLPELHTLKIGLYPQLHVVKALCSKPGMQSVSRTFLILPADFSAPHHDPMNEAGDSSRDIYDHLLESSATVLR
jgi:hypothetical protein